MRTKTNRTKSSLPFNSGVATYSGSNRYVPGAGVGAVSSSVRRAKIRFATGCSQSGANCGAFYLTLGNDKLPIVPSLPAVPTITSITPNNEALTVSFTPGVGGGPVTNYAYSINGSAGPFIPLAPASVASPFTIEGLENGEGYDVCIVALSSSSASSAPSNMVEAVPAREPDAPAGIVAAPGDREATISFTPGYDGGSPITDYLYSIDNGVTFLPAESTATPIVISGLTNGVTYLVRLKATNEIGNSNSSNPVSVVPAGVPDPPTSLDAVPGKTAAYIYFTPGANRGSVITNYSYSIDDGAYQSAGTTASPIVVSGLTLGNTYQVRLKATNAIGTGNSSSAIAVVPVDLVQFTTTIAHTWIVPPDVSFVDYLVVGGGGGSGGTHDGGGAGGGGGGMVLAGTNKGVAPGASYEITVGDGGAPGGGYPSGSPNRETDGSSGDNSVFGDVTALGGGFGYRSRSDGFGNPGTQPIKPGTATTGGRGGSFTLGGGGGGGDSADGGANPPGFDAGAGGAGTPSDITGTPLTYGAGGDGGPSQTASDSVPGADNTGNGAKGPGTPFGSFRFGAKGGSGIVVLKYR